MRMWIKFMNYSLLQLSLSFCFCAHHADPSCLRLCAKNLFSANHCFVLLNCFHFIFQLLYKMFTQIHHFSTKFRFSSVENAQMVREVNFVLAESEYTVCMTGMGRKLEQCWARRRMVWHIDQHRMRKQEWRCCATLQRLDHCLVLFLVSFQP